MAKNRRERFEDVAGRRVQFILKKIQLLGNCSNTNNYEYTENDIKKMFGAIREELKRTELKFADLKKDDITDNKFKF